MKKYFLTTLLGFFLLTSSAANASGFYMGLDAVLSRTHYKYHNKFNIEQNIVAPNTVTSSKNIGAGAYLGYKFSSGNAFLAPEIFYDYLNSNTKDYYHSIERYKNDELSLRSRYGAKMNLGYNFIKGFAGYITYGIANVDYIGRFYYNKASENQRKVTPIYGVGVVLRMTNNWGLKAEYNRQSFATSYHIDAIGISSKINLDVLKVGLSYGF